MAPRVSAEIKQAVELVAQGMTAYEAAKQIGVSATGIRRSAGYQSLLVAGKVNLGKAGRKPEK